MDTDERDVQEPQRYAVLDVFGLKLEVSNPRIAELLTMDAKEFVTTDVRELSPRSARELRAEAAQAAPDVVLVPPSARDGLEAAQRIALRESVADVGTTLGFDAGPDGVWRSPTGLSIVTRAVDRAVSLAGASHFVTELMSRRNRASDADSTVLFVVDGQQSADVFKVAILQQRLYDQMRVVSLENLREIAALHESRLLDHARVLILLTPIANVDVGEVLSVIRAADLMPGETV